MTDKQKQLVQNSFARVATDPAAAASLFYQRLFELDPELRPLFRSNMEEQGRKLMQMIAYAVHGLDRLEQLIPAVRDLGARHGTYGVQPAHYATVGQALLSTLATALGDEFSPDVREAWTGVYNTLASVMQEGASKAASA
ncbi:MAG: globin family protein [Bryobacteraceae bacterium]|nr:globin family protein [Bryobacteraceae bacterium]